jgi:hypothetical protein
MRPASHLSIMRAASALDHLPSVETLPLSHAPYGYVALDHAPPAIERAAHGLRQRAIDRPGMSALAQVRPLTCEHANYMSLDPVIYYYRHDSL